MTRSEQPSRFRNSGLSCVAGWGTTWCLRRGYNPKVAVSNPAPLSRRTLVTVFLLVPMKASQVSDPSTVRRIAEKGEQERSERDDSYHM
jgi:hypothetical protein